MRSKYSVPRSLISRRRAVASPFTNVAMGVFIDSEWYDKLHPNSSAIVSRAHLSVESLRVEMTASAPIICATRFVSAFAPPTCPDNNDTAYEPTESIFTTAGSLYFDSMTGAIHLTAIPIAPTKMSDSQLLKFSLTHPASEST